MYIMSMNEFFELIFCFQGTYGDGPDGRTHDTAGLVLLMRSDPEFALRQRSFWENYWRNEGRLETVARIQVLVGLARYLSDLIGGDVPLFAPRDVIDASLGINGKNNGEALIGKALFRAVQNSVQEQAAAMSEAQFAEFERMLQGVMNNTAPSHSKYLTTEQVATRLSLSRATVERKFRKGEILGDKTAGNQWRTTEEKLRLSPYLKGKGRRRRAELE